MKDKSELQKFINRLVKSQKSAAGESVDCFALIKDLLGIKQAGYFPRSFEQLRLARLLGAEVGYKRSFKSACDEDHPLAKENLMGVGLSESEAMRLIDLAKPHNPEHCGFFELFEGDIDTNGFSLSLIIQRIDDLASKSSFGTVVSHSPKMTNPDCRSPRIYVDNLDCRPDGFIRTGNCSPDFDLHITATHLRVYKLLSLTAARRTVFDMIKSRDASALSGIFEVDQEKAHSWIEMMTHCVSSQDTNTHRLIRQVYFPVSGSYHLLSLLKPSGLVFLLKTRIDWLNNRSKSAYLGRKAKKDSLYFEGGFSSLPGLTTTKHGGDHPKNISGLNNKHQSYYLLSSVPPALEPREIRFPRTDFFNDSIHFYECRESLQKLHGIFKTNIGGDIPAKNLKSGLQRRVGEILDLIIQRMWALRSVSADQYRVESSKLPSYQKTWLCEVLHEQREVDDAWLDKLCGELAAWIIRAYEKTIKKSLQLGSEESSQIKSLILVHKEALR